jgi:hypothetical protein
MEELKRYIKRNLKKGYTKESLKWALINQGNSRIEVEKAIKKVDIELAAEAPELKVKPQIKYELIEPKEYATRITNYPEKKSWWKKIFRL